MKVEWYCQVMGSEVGPLTQSQLIDMVRHQRLRPEDLVRRDNSAWVAAFEVKGLFAAASKRPMQSLGSRFPEQPNEPPPPPVSAKQDSPPPRGTIPMPSVGPKDWYCIASGEKRGPIDFAELKALMADGRLRQTDRVWRSSAPKFRRASEIKELRAG